MKKHSILIVEDDVHIGDMLQEALELESCFVRRAYSGTEALMLLEQEKPDMMLLDLMIPGISGEELLGRVDGVLTIVISAKSDIDSKINLLKKGASDYVTKPFAVTELLARIEAQLRLAALSESKAVFAEEAVIRVGNISLDNSLFLVTNGKIRVNLTRTEAAILGLLMRNANRPIGRSTILDRISYDTPDCTERSLKQHISNIRKKLRQLDDRDPIEPVYGIGYQYNES